MLRNVDWIARCYHSFNNSISGRTKQLSEDDDLAILVLPYYVVYGALAFVGCFRPAERKATDIGLT